jgi:hypothetical protein
MSRLLRRNFRYQASDPNHEHDGTVRTLINRLATNLTGIQIVLPRASKTPVVYYDLYHGSVLHVSGDGKIPPPPADVDAFPEGCSVLGACDLVGNVYA